MVLGSAMNNAEITAALGTWVVALVLIAAAAFALVTAAVQ